MNIKCAWCKKDMGEKEPLDDKSTTHTICPKCSRIHFGRDLRTEKELADLKAMSEVRIRGNKRLDSLSLCDLGDPRFNVEGVMPIE